MLFLGLRANDLVSLTTRQHTSIDKDSRVIA